MVAIVCIIVAVLTSAQRADEVALDHDKRLLTRSITNHGERILRELESVALTEQAVRNVRTTFDQTWVQSNVGLWLKNFFDHDFVFVADSRSNLVYALLGRASVDPRWFNSILPELAPTVDYVRGRAGANPDRAIRISESANTSDQIATTRVALVQQFLGRPAIVAAVLILPIGEAADPSERQTAPIMLTVKFIDEEVLAEIANRLQLRNLRKIGSETIAADDHTLDLADERGNSIARFAWSPKRPGAEIVQSVIPFIAVALAGFALLAALIFGYMRRTTATIAASENSLRYLALHDPLCGLPNRNYFGERLQSVIKDVQRGGSPAAVFYIDLDHFKDVNDTLGHPVGDELIRNVTFRLSGTLRSEDVVARLGGDEFAVISSLGTDTTTLQQTANRIIAALCAPYSINGHNIVIGASIGIAIIDRRSDGGAADIMRYADMALYRAKNEGRNRACIYDAAMDADLSNRKLLEHDLRLAIEQDGLNLQYQPIVNSSGENILGVEALCRWIHPDAGKYRTREIHPDRGTFRADHRARRMGAAPRLHGRKDWPDITVAVNVSPLQFRRLDFVDVVERILAQTDLDPNRLELELTESTLLGNVETAEIAMHRLKALGVKLALDDFGTGYSSLGLSAPLPVRQAQDRPLLRPLDRARARRGGDRACDRRSRPRPWHESHRRRRGNRRTTALPACRGRALHAGISLRQAGLADPDRREARCSGRLAQHRRRRRRARRLISLSSEK